jgi:hypothetical protein
MEKFIGHKLPGETHGSSVVKLNTRIRREAKDYVAAHGGRIEGYLHGMYRRGWLVLAGADLPGTGLPPGGTI